MPPTDRFITVAIHTYEKAIALRALLEREGIEVQFRNVNIEQPVVASGIRVRIRENDLPLALRIIENRDIFTDPVGPALGADSKLPVLVPVDFSNLSIQAATAAFGLADCHDTTIVFYHTYIDPYVAGTIQLTDSRNYENSEAASREVFLAKANAQMRHFTQRIKELIKVGDLPPVKFDTCVAEGVPEDSINDYTKARNPFMIVMGTRGSRQKEADMIGSVTAEVLDKCRFPVLALPDGTSLSHSRISKILFLSNLEQEDILAIDTLYRLFPKAAAMVTMATLPAKKRLIMRNSSDSAKALKDYCNANFRNYSFTIAPIGLNGASEQFGKLEQENNFDLIVVPNKKKNAFSRLFNPSVANRILFSADKPMLVIPV